MTSPGEMHHLSLYEECAGSIKTLTDHDGALIALVGRTCLVLPLDMEENLRPLIGQKISILRTDIPGKSYIFRVLAEENAKDVS